MAIIIILICGAILRFASIDQSLWLDEATTALVARDLSWQQFFVKFLPADFHPPLYYVLIKLWTGLAGNHSEIALRLPSLVFGLINVFLVFKIGEVLKNKKFGLIAAALLATAPLHIYYSQEARMYSLAAMLVTLAIYAYVSKKYKLFAFALAACYWADYLTAFIPIIFIIHAWHWNRTQFKKTLQVIFFSIIGALPMLLFFPQQFLNGLSVEGSNWWGILGQTNLKNVFLIPVKFTLGRISFEQPLYQIVVILTGSIFGFLYFKATKLFSKYSLFWLWLFFPIVGGVVIGFFIPVVTYFRFLFVLPAFYFVAAIGIFETKKYFLLAFAVIICLNLIFTSIYLFTPRFQREDWRGLVEFIEESPENSQVIFPANSQMEAYKFYSSRSNFGGPNTLSYDSEQIWLIRYVYDIFDPEDITRKRVEALGYEKVAEHDFRGIVVFKYARRN